MIGRRSKAHAYTTAQNSEVKRSTRARFGQIRYELKVRYKEITNHAQIPVTSILVETATAGEDDQRDLGFAEDGKLIGLLEQPVPALAEGHLSARRVLDPLDLNLPPPHGSKESQP